MLEPDGAIVIETVDHIGSLLEARLAKLAMLMSIPTILASGAVLGAEVIGDANAALARDAGIAAVLSFVAALFALTLMMRLLKSVSFTPYVIYRIVLGLVLLGLALIVNLLVMTVRGTAVRSAYA